MTFDFHNLLFVQRLRPDDAGVTHLFIWKSVDWSSPSDHATATLAIVTAFVLEDLPLRTLMLSVLASAICYSRDYVGMHYVTDILDGVQPEFWLALPSDPSIVKHRASISS